MRYVLLFVLLPLLCFAQVNVKINPNVHDWQTVFDDTLVTKDTTLAVSCKEWQGVCTAVFDWDQLPSGDASDSCMTIEMELYHGSGYNEVLGENDNGIGWGRYYNGAAATALIDTLDRSLENGYNIFYEIGAQDAFMMADSARWIISIGTGDSSLVRIEVGGQ